MQREFQTMQQCFKMCQRPRVSLFWFAVFVAATHVASASVTCQEGMERCNNSTQCYYTTEKCNGYYECEDGSDEADCRVECDANEFRCGDDECIPEHYVCDGTDDCEDGSDEAPARCERTDCALSSDFKCVSDNNCIHSLLKCDGTAHCSDASDELNCSKHGLEQAAVTSGGHLACEENEFDCKGDGSQCISNDKKCNFDDDCENGEDENEDTCQSSAVFTCEDGATCSQGCEDTEGSGYHCTCHTGYKLAHDGHNCIPADGMETILVTDGYSIIRYDILNGNARESTIEVGRPIDGLDYDYAGNKTFFMDSHNHSIHRMNPNGSNQEMFIGSLAERPVALSYDWVHGNLYFAEATNIQVVTVQHKWRRVLFADPEVNHVRTLAVDPRSSQRYIYWGQSSQHSGIYKAGLDGSNLRRIVHTTIEHPTAMTIDFDSGDGKLMWLDSFLHCIMTLDIATGQARLLFEIIEHNGHLTGLAVFAGSVYWTEKSSGSVYTIQTGIQYSEEEPAGVFMDSFTVPKNVIAYHHLKQPAGINACSSENGGCSHICLPSPFGSLVEHRCFCPNAGTFTYSMNADNRTCTATKLALVSTTVSTPSTTSSTTATTTTTVARTTVFTTADKVRKAHSSTAPDAKMGSTSTVSITATSKPFTRLGSPSTPSSTVTARLNAVKTAAVSSMTTVSSSTTKSSTTSQQSGLFDAQDDDGIDTEDKKGQDSNIWIIVGIGVGVLILCIVVGILVGVKIQSKRRRQQLKISQNKSACQMDSLLHDGKPNGDKPPPSNHHESPA